MNIKKIMHVTAWMIALLLATPPLQAGFFDSLKNAFSFINTPHCQRIAARISGFCFCLYTMTQFSRWYNRKNNPRNSKPAEEKRNNDKPDLNTLAIIGIDEQGTVQAILKAICKAQLDCNRPLTEPFVINKNLGPLDIATIFTALQSAALYAGSINTLDPKITYLGRDHYGILVQLQQKLFLVVCTLRKKLTPHNNDLTEIVLRFETIKDHQINAQNLWFPWIHPEQPPVTVHLKQLDHRLLQIRAALNPIRLTS
jgi:hypothetical protein